MLNQKNYDWIDYTKLGRINNLVFKKQIVQLYQNGKSKADIAKEYDVHISVIGRWLSQYDNSGSFKEKENRSELELENIQLKKRNKELEMENDILKQAALILGRK